MFGRQSRQPPLVLLATQRKLTATTTGRFAHKVAEVEGALRVSADREYLLDRFFHSNQQRLQIFTRLVSRLQAAQQLVKVSYARFQLLDFIFNGLVGFFQVGVFVLQVSCVVSESVDQRLQLRDQLVDLVDGGVDRAQAEGDPDRERHGECVECQQSGKQRGERRALQRFGPAEKSEHESGESAKCETWKEVVAPVENDLKVAHGLLFATLELLEC